MVSLKDVVMESIMLCDWRTSSCIAINTFVKIRWSTIIHSFDNVVQAMLQRIDVITSDSILSSGMLELIEIIQDR